MATMTNSSSLKPVSDDPAYRAACEELRQAGEQVGTLRARVRRYRALTDGRIHEIDPATDEERLEALAERPAAERDRALAELRYNRGRAVAEEKLAAARAELNAALEPEGRAVIARVDRALMDLESAVAALVAYRERRERLEVSAQQFIAPVVGTDPWRRHMREAELLD